MYRYHHIRKPNEMTTEEVLFLALHLSPHVPGPLVARKTGTPH
jgi:hypothetical protein